MASAGDGNRPVGGGDGAGQPRPQQHQQVFRIPLPRNLPPGQRYTLRFNIPGAPPGQGQGAAAAAPGQGGIRVIMSPQGQGAAAQGQGAAGVNAIVQQLQEQQRERMQREEQLREIKEHEERAKEEDRLRREKLKGKLKYQQPLKVEFDEEAVTASLSWERKEVEVPGGSEEVLYFVLASSEGTKQEGKEVYSGTDNCCTVGGDILIFGHTHHFTVSASLGDISGDPSPKASLTVPARPPSKPLPPRASNRTKSALALRWNAPQDNGSVILHYELEWDQGTGEWQQVASDKAKQFKFTHKFKPGSRALFRVRAVNSVGSSPFSDPLEFFPGAAAPSVPQPPSMTSSGVRSIALVWVPPPSNGADIVSYTLEMEDPNSGYGFRPVYQGENTSFSCSGLQRASNYNFRLVATNEKGPSPTSPSVTYSTIPGVPGNPPAPFNLDRPTANSLSISWKEPTDSGGAVIETYVLQMSGGVASEMMSSELAWGEFADAYSGPNKSYVAEGLQPGRKYRTRVCAVSSGGQSEWSPLAVLSTPAIRPSPPLYVYVLGKPTQTSITIQWGYPLSDGGSPIISYGIEMMCESDTDWNLVATVADPRTFESPSTPTSSSPTTPQTPQTPLVHTVTKLSPGETYHFRVTCRNSIGGSGPSAECKGQTGPGQPDCPCEVESSEITANSAHLKWKESGCHGCPVESYSLQWFAELQSQRVHSSSSITNHTTLHSLCPATSYQARVKAESSAGPSDWSLPVTFTTSPSAPSPPTFTKLISCTPSSLLVAWNVPLANGSPIIAYYVEVGVESGHVTSHVTKVDATETQHTISDLKPSTTYRYRIQAENAVGRGLFGAYGSGSTLPPPPSPPHLTLSSCSPHTLKVSWGKRPARNITYLLHMASQGNQFHEVFRGNAVTHRITRLQPDTEYTLKIASLSSSGQGEWSDHVTFMTTPTPPSAPSGLVLKQTSNDLLQLDWQAVDFPHPLIYEAQYRVANSNQEYQQCYKGVDCSANISLPSSKGIGSGMYEARLRSCAMCSVNGREEQLWSQPSPVAQCRWEEEEVLEKPVEEAEEKGGAEPVKEGLGGRWNSPWTVSLLLFMVFTLLTVVVALILGQVAV